MPEKENQEIDATQTEQAQAQQLKSHMLHLIDVYTSYTALDVLYNKDCRLAYDEMWCFAKTHGFVGADGCICVD